MNTGWLILAIFLLVSAAGKIKFWGTIPAIALHITLGLLGIWVLAIAAS
jgi:hypothetical protein